VATWTIEVRALKPADARFGLELNSEMLGRPAVETEPTRIFDPKNPDSVREGTERSAAPTGGREGAAGPALTPRQIENEAEAAPAAGPANDEQK
jgi:hypothetical protein